MEIFFRPKPDASGEGGSCDRPATRGGSLRRVASGDLLQPLQRRFASVNLRRRAAERVQVSRHRTGGSGKPHPPMGSLVSAPLSNVSVHGFTAPRNWQKQCSKQRAQALFATSSPRRPCAPALPKPGPRLGPPQRSIRARHGGGAGARHGVGAARAHSHCEASESGGICEGAHRCGR